MDQLKSNSSNMNIIKLITVFGKDTLANEILELEGSDFNIDSIVKDAKLKAIEDLSLSKSCKKPCCLGCKATDTEGLVVKCLADHSCCNPNFKITEELKKQI